MYEKVNCLYYANENNHSVSSTVLQIRKNVEIHTQRILVILLVYLETQ